MTLDLQSLKYPCFRRMNNEGMPTITANATIADISSALPKRRESCNETVELILSELSVDNEVLVEFDEALVIVLA